MRLQVILNTHILSLSLSRYSTRKSSVLFVHFLFFSCPSDKILGVRGGTLIVHEIVQGSHKDSLLQQQVNRLARLGERKRAADDLGGRHRGDRDANAARALLLALALVRARLRVEAPLNEVTL